MKVDQLIQFLMTQDPQAEVWVMHVKDTNSGTRWSWVQLDINQDVEYVDLRDNRFAKGKPYENDRCLYLGSYD